MINRIAGEMDIAWAGSAARRMRHVNVQCLGNTSGRLVRPKANQVPQQRRTLSCGMAGRRVASAATDRYPDPGTRYRGLPREAADQSLSFGD